MIKVDIEEYPMTNSSQELAGRVALVTGAGRNIGRGIALALAAGGAAIAVNVRSNKAEADAVVREIEAKGGRAKAFIADIADASAVERMVAGAVAHFGRIDFLINNAALRREKPFDQMTYAEWREVMGVTLDGVFFCIKACLPQLKASGAGAIVNIGGLSAYTGSKDRAHVVTAKAGLGGLTRALAHDLAHDRITVNLVSPGLIGTARPAGSPEPQHHSIHSTLTGERGAPEEIAPAVRFLCGPGARYITGQQIHVNGGAYLG
jgi:3-oxoacyl-[acyl-carrier protein] reductase